MALGMLAAGVFFSGQFTLLSCIRPFLETVTRVDASTLSVILLMIGLAGFVGTMLIGTLLMRALYLSTLEAGATMLLIAAGLAYMAARAEAEQAT